MCYHDILLEYLRKDDSLMQIWILFVFLYGILKGFREIVKKKALERSSLMEVLFFYTFIGFLFVLPDAKTAMQLTLPMIGYICIKSFIIFIAWILGFTAIQKMSVSLYSVLDLSMVIFSTAFGLLILKEHMTISRSIGLLLVLTGLILVNLRGSEKTEKAKPKYIAFVIISSLLNAASALMDKILMKEITSSQLQFWFMFLMSLMYLAYLIAAKVTIHWNRLKKNYWIFILGIMSVLGDRVLFMANAIPDSKITIMTLIKQCSCIITIIIGKFVFKERDIGYKLLCAGIVIAGIAIALIW